MYSASRALGQRRNILLVWPAYLGVWMGDCGFWVGMEHEAAEKRLLDVGVPAIPQPNYRVFRHMALWRLKRLLEHLAAWGVLGLLRTGTCLHLHNVLWWRFGECSAFLELKHG